MLKSVISLMIWTALGIVVVLGLYLPAQAHRQALKAELAHTRATNENLAARIAAFEDSGAEFIFPEEMLWRGAAKPDAELALQGDVLHAAETAGLNLSAFGTRSLPQKTERGVIAIELEGEGPLSSFYAYLSKLEQITPRAAINSLRIRPSRRATMTAEMDQMIYFQMTVWGYWGPQK